jgi:hypothetical protein
MSVVPPRGVQGGEVSRKSTESKTQPNITEAAERTGLLIRGLQNRLADRPSDESAENLEWELQKYFAAEVGPEISCRFPLNKLRQRVIDGVADKILAGWEWGQEGNATPLENEVTQKLIERIFERLIGSRTELCEGRKTLPASKASGKLPETQLPA